MTWIFSVLGAALVAVALRDIYATLWHPHGLGTLSRGVFRGIWWVAGKIRRHGRALGSAGPLGMIAAVLLWAALIVGGWALIYLPHMPGGFSFASALQPQSSSDPVASLYLSLVTVATLGYGDITPVYPVLRLLLPVQALIGFVLFTAAISWILQIYPALIRRRAAARTVHLLISTGSTEVARRGEASIACALLDELTEVLTTVEFDLRQYGETYFSATPPPIGPWPRCSGTLPLWFGPGRHRRRWRCAAPQCGSSSNSGRSPAISIAAICTPEDRSNRSALPTPPTTGTGPHHGDPAPAMLREQVSRGRRADRGRPAHSAGTPRRRSGSARDGNCAGRIRHRTPDRRRRRPRASPW